MKIFLSELFKELNKKEVKYCVLRNYEKLPDWVDNDVDIWIQDEYKKIFFNIVKDLSGVFNYILYYTINYSPRLSTEGEGDYFLIKEKKGAKFIIHIDCWTKIHWKGIEFVDTEVLRRKLLWDNRGFYIPPRGFEASVVLLKGLLYNNLVKDKYKKKIIKYSQWDTQNFYGSIRKSFGTKTADFIVEKAKEGNWKDLERRSNVLRLILLFKSLSRLLSQSRNCLNYFRAQMKRYFINPHGLFIVFLGPDGSGKTTTAKLLLKSEIAKKLFQKKSYFHGHFSYLPELKKISLLFKIKKNSIRKGKVALPLKPLGAFRSMLYPCYYGLSYFLGNLFVWRERARSGLIVFDRYFYDYFIQILYERCPRWVLNLIAHVIPKPDIIIYLKNDSSEIYNRKPELPKNEIGRQARICEHLVKNIKNSITIETSINKETVIEMVQDAIVNKLRQKGKLIK